MELTMERQLSRSLIKKSFLPADCMDTLGQFGLNAEAVKKAISRT